VPKPNYFVANFLASLSQVYPAKENVGNKYGGISSNAYGMPQSKSDSYSGTDVMYGRKISGEENKGEEVTKKKKKKEEKRRVEKEDESDSDEEYQEKPKSKSMQKNL